MRGRSTLVRTPIRAYLAFRMHPTHLVFCVMVGFEIGLLCLSMILSLLGWSHSSPSPSPAPMVSNVQLVTQ